MLLISCVAKKIDACAIASGNDNGSSAITGQPIALVNFEISSTFKPPRSCPITTTPRAPTNRRVPAFFPFFSGCGLSFISFNQSESESGNSGSSN
ncbi:unannotated protein [freshwater metagenome]|uniref:Unannotated protein n=1 Tax=freshwater metagenome TaxID=449393 RepID=A0A6J6IPU9_9ZZZZ